MPIFKILVTNSNIEIQIMPKNYKNAGHCGGQQQTIDLQEMLGRTNEVVINVDSVTEILVSLEKNKSKICTVVKNKSEFGRMGTCPLSESMSEGSLDMASCMRKSQMRDKARRQESCMDNSMFGSSEKQRRRMRDDERRPKYGARDMYDCSGMKDMRKRDPCGERSEKKKLDPCLKKGAGVSKGLMRYDERCECPKSGRDKSRDMYQNGGSFETDWLNKYPFLDKKPRDPCAKSSFRPDEDMYDDPCAGRDKRMKDSRSRCQESSRPDPCDMKSTYKKHSCLDSSEKMRTSRPDREKSQKMRSRSSKPDPCGVKYQNSREKSRTRGMKPDPCGGGQDSRPRERPDPCNSSKSSEKLRKSTKGDSCQDSRASKPDPCGGQESRSRARPDPCKNSKSSEKLRKATKGDSCQDSRASKPDPCAGKGEKSRSRASKPDPCKTKGQESPMGVRGSKMEPCKRPRPQPSIAPADIGRYESGPSCPPTPCMPQALSCVSIDPCPNPCSNDATDRIGVSNSTFTLKSDKMEELGLEDAKRKRSSLQIDDSDEVWIVQCPKNVDLRDLIGAKIKLGGSKTSFKVDEVSIDCLTQQYSENRTLSIAAGNGKLRQLDTVGAIKIKKRNLSTTSICQEPAIKREASKINSDSPKRKKSNNEY